MTGEFGLGQSPIVRMTACPESTEEPVIGLVHAQRAYRIHARGTPGWQR
jgi:hypothetical protein